MRSRGSRARSRRGRAQRSQPGHVRLRAALSRSGVRDRGGPRRAARAFAGPSPAWTPQPPLRSQPRCATTASSAASSSPADADYDQARAGWNGAIDRRPAAVAYADATPTTSPRRSAPRAALGLRFTIRAGGHSVSGPLGPRRRALHRHARAQRGRGRPRDARSSASAAARCSASSTPRRRSTGSPCPAGQISHTGVGGLTLGGGIGWLMRHHGLTIDSLLAAEVVLADGRIVRASPTSTPTCSGRCAAAAATSASSRASSSARTAVGPIVLGGMLVYPWEQAREALRASRALMDGRARRADDLRRAASPRRRRRRSRRAAGPPRRRRRRRLERRPRRGRARARAAARGAARRRSTSSARCRTSRCSRCSTQTAPHGWQLLRPHALPARGRRRLHRRAARRLRARRRRRRRTSMTGWLGGAIDRVAPGETAFGHRGARALTWIIGCSGDEPARPGRRLGAASSGRPRRRSRPAASTSTRSTPSARSRDAYADDVWERLVAVKRRYDPDGVFDAATGSRLRRALRARRARPPRRGCARRAWPSTRPTWCSAVFGAITSRSAISAFERPAATRCEHLALARGRARRARRARPCGPRRRARAAARRPGRRRARAPSRSKASRAARAEASASGEPAAAWTRASASRARASSSGSPSAAKPRRPPRRAPRAPSPRRRARRRAGEQRRLGAPDPRAPDARALAQPRRAASRPRRRRRRRERDARPRAGRARRPPPPRSSSAARKLRGRRAARCSRTSAGERDGLVLQPVEQLARPPRRGPGAGAARRAPPAAAPGRRRGAVRPPRSSASASTASARSQSPARTSTAP